MSAGKPWETDWCIVEDLCKGGQGKTYRAESRREPSRTAVVKVLKNQSSMQARRRMRTEVVNLDVLANAGIKVPQVLGGNTEEYANPSVPLYFVMEFIVGNTLKTQLTERGPLSLRESVDITCDLLSTITDAHKTDVLHRDLKPDNIVVRAIDPMDAMIVDYGLSFNNNNNEDGDQSLTLTTEQFRNKFLDLPENYAPGGNRRDKRSDLTALCGVFYFCLTGRIPGTLRDGNNKAPHRRPGDGVRTALIDASQATQIELFLDRAFAPEVEYRFQDSSELGVRLKRLIQPSLFSEEDHVQIAAEIAGLLRQNDRKTQIAEYNERINKLFNAVLASLTSHVGKKVAPFVIHISLGSPFRTNFPNGMERLSSVLTVRIDLAVHNASRFLIFETGAQGRQCVFLRAMGAQKPGGTPSLMREWEDLIHFDPEQPPDVEQFVSLILKSIAPMMKELYAETQT